MSTIGVASARSGARTRSPSAGGPAYRTSAKITSLPCVSAGRNGIGGAGMTFAMVESSSGAASESSMKRRTVSAVAGSMNIPPKHSPSGAALNWKRVTTPKLPPPPRIAQKRSGSVRASTRRIFPSAVTISAAINESMVRPCFRTR